MYNHLILTARRITGPDKCINVAGRTPSEFFWHYRIFDDSLLNDHSEDIDTMCNFIELASDADEDGFVRKALEGLGSNEDILLFIHGYHPAKISLHFHLLHKLHQQYVAGGDSRLKRIIFLSWPNRGLMPAEDDEANAIGATLNEKYLDMLAHLSQKLREKKGRLHLMAQSFGNQVLNGFISTFSGSDFVVAQHLFGKIFLMAADVPFKGAQNGGKRLVALLGKSRDYRFDWLSDIAERVVVFHDPIDAVLESSQDVIFGTYRRLGHVGLKPPLSRYPGNFECPDHKLYSKKMVKLRHGFDSIKNENERHQYFITNPLVVSMVKDYLAAPPASVPVPVLVAP